MQTSGQQIGPYTLIKNIGFGNFGEVWLAERRTLLKTDKKHCAIKFPLPNRIDLDLLRREVFAWQRASGHRNIVELLEADEYNGQIIIVSEYIPDESLTELLNNFGHLPTDIAIEFTLHILVGLEHLHSLPEKIIHRDLKPSNILLKGKTACIADFGISRVLQENEDSFSNVVAGTPLYMSPEAHAGKRNEQTDIWSVGVILYRMVTGCLPFQNVSEIITGSPAKMPDEIPLELQNIILKALHSDTKKRFKSANEMRTALHYAGNEAFKEGFNYYSAGDYNNAITHFTLAISLNPRITSHYNNRGVSYKEIGEYDKAIADYTKAIELAIKMNLASAEADAYNNRAVAHFSKGNYNLAIEDCNNSVKLNPSFAKPYNNRANAFKKLNQYNNALEDYTKAIEMDSRFYEAYYNRGLIYQKMGEFDKSLTDFNDAIKINPKLAVAIIHCGDIHKNKGEYDEAISKYTSALDLNPNDANTYNNRGFCYFSNNQYDKALLDFNRAIELNPCDPLPYNNCGAIYKKKGDLKEAEKYFLEAIKLEPNFVEAHNNFKNLLI